MQFDKNDNYRDLHLIFIIKCAMIFLENDSATILEAEASSFSLQNGSAII
jgi:hypothetical protein